MQALPQHGRLICTHATEDNARHFPGWEWITKCDNDKKSSWVKPPYDVPYRVLYSRILTISSLGGRNMSVTHVALGGTVRVQGTLGMAGEVIEWLQIYMHQTQCRAEGCI